MKNKMKYLILVLAFALPSLLFSQSPAEIVNKAENAIKGETCKGSFTMTIVTPDFTRTVKMDSWWIGNEKALIVIKSPAKEAGDKTLKIGKEIWNYLKATETTIKIPPSMMLASWNGSDLTNDDLTRESNLVKDYDLKMLKEEKIAGETCWKIELVPKPDAPVVWGRLYYWVRKVDYLPALIQYYDEKGELYRTMEFSGYQMMGNRKIPTHWKVVSNKKENHYTEFTYDEVKFDVKINPQIFSFRELEK